METEENDDVVRLRKAADTLIAFFDEAMLECKKFKEAELEYETLISRVDPAVKVFSDVKISISKKMGWRNFLSHPDMRRICKELMDKEQEFRKIQGVNQNDHDDDTIGELGEKYRSFVLLNDRIHEAGGTLKGDNAELKELAQSKISALKNERKNIWNELLDMAFSDENSSILVMCLKK